MKIYPNHLARKNMHMAINTSTSTNEDEPPFKRRRLTVIKKQMTILMLPDDLILNCLARISRLYYPTLSLVSKRFRSLLTPVELYQTRTLLSCTETCLYVSLQLHSDPKTLRWLTLCRRPYSSKNTLVPVSSPGSLSAPWSDVAVVGHNIYIIGGLTNNNNESSSSVMVFDCYSHTLRKSPSMHLTRFFPSACAFDEKIYVTGGTYKTRDTTNWMEVFDTKTQTWEFLHIPCEDLCRGYKFESVAHEGTIYVLSKDKHVAYKLHKGNKWRAIDLAMDLGWDCSLSYCVIENVFYRCNSIEIYWYDPKRRSWKILKGLEKLPRFSSKVKIVDCGGRMGVLWEEDEVSVNKHKKRIIWFAEITIDKQQTGEIRGTVNGPDIVSTTSEPYTLVHVLATTI